MPHFTYCSSVWHSCLKEYMYIDCLERLHKRTLRYMFNDFSKGYDSLCSKIGYSLVVDGNRVKQYSPVHSIFI